MVVRATAIDADAFEAPVNANDTVLLLVADCRSELVPDCGSELSNFTPTVKVAGPVPAAGLTVIHGWFDEAVHVTVPEPPVWVSRTV
jgi:hypothetical protein